jgi:transposase-like protein
VETEIRRRSTVFAIFPDDRAITRLVGAMLLQNLAAVGNFDAWSAFRW